MNCPVCEQLVDSDPECGVCGWIRPAAPGIPGAPGERLSELEFTQHLSGPSHVQVQPLLELERHRNPSPEDRAPPGVEGLCRYCQNVQATGLFCDHCGMRVNRAPAPNPTVDARPQNSEEKVRCRACGAAAFPGEPCRDCGVPVPAV